MYWQVFAWRRLRTRKPPRRVLRVFQRTGLKIRLSRMQPFTSTCATTVWIMISHFSLQFKSQLAIFVDKGSLKETFFGIQSEILRKVLIFGILLAPLKMMRITVRQKRRSSKWFETSNPRKWRVAAVNPGWPRSKSPSSLLTSTIFTTLKLLSINLQHKSISLRALAATGFFTVYFFPILLPVDLRQIALSPVWWWGCIELETDLGKCLQTKYWILVTISAPARSGCHPGQMAQRSQVGRIALWECSYVN